jgi:signal peptidase I
MSETQDTPSASPFVTLWLSPRQTIERIVTTRPTYLVVPLAMFGVAAAFYTELVGLGFADKLGDWWLWLGFVAGSAVFGLIWLYTEALILRWSGLLLRGRASAQQLRAVVAWSTVPTILGAAIAFLATVVLTAAGAVDQWGGRYLLVVIFNVWSLIVFLLMLGRVQHFGFWRTIAAYLLGFLLPLLLAGLFRSFLYQPFNVPASSMMPTLLVGDDFFVSKFPYGYSRFSLPFSPSSLSGRLFGSEPKRGDVVVFRLPRDEHTDYVKRVVGMPGERIQMKEGMLTINDVPVKREPIADFAGDACGSGAGPMAKRWRETLPNGASYETLDCVANGFLDNTGVFTVPPGHYFMLGDNRDNSTDSRVSTVGSIPLENLVGRADRIYFSRDPETHETRSERVLMPVR